MACVFGAKVLSRSCHNNIFSIISVGCLHDISRVPRVRSDRTSVRHKIQDYGYKFNYYQWGERYPRIKDAQQPVFDRIESEKIKNPADVRLIEKREEERKDEWTEEKATFGQNDYIDLLGDGSVHPAQLLYHVPPWLRGFPGNQNANELVKLIHFRNVYKRKLMRNAPKQWHEICKRIRHLMKYNNYYKQDEMHPERNLGLWEEEPDYFYKDKERRSFLDLP